MSQRSILVLEDDARFGEQVVELFGFLGHRVTLASTGASGIKAFSDEEYSLLVCDLTLPDMGGVAVVRAIRALPGGADLPVLLMSAVYKTPKLFERELRELGVVEFLPKPFSLIELGRTVEVLTVESAEVSGGDARITATGSWRTEKVRTLLGDGEPAFGKSGAFAQRDLLFMMFEGFHQHVAGRLTLRNDKVARELYFLNGYPVWASSNVKEEQLEAVLVRNELLTADEAKTVRRLSFQEKVSYGAAAMRSGLVSERRLLMAEKDQVRQLVVGCFAWKKGQYEFQRGDSFVSKIPIHEVNPLACMQEATLRHLELNELAPEIYPRGEHRLVPGPRHARLMPYVVLPEVLDGLAEAISEGMTVGELFVTYRVHTEKLIKMLWLLFRLGIAESMEKLPDSPTELPVGLSGDEDNEPVPPPPVTADLPFEEMSTMREIRLLMSREAWSAATPKLRGLARSYPESVSVLSALGWCVYNLGVMPGGDEDTARDEAISLLERVLSLDPEHALAHHYMNRISGRPVIE
jgi:CheY-like chemotaxis protein